MIRSCLLELNMSMIETFPFRKNSHQSQRDFTVWHIPLCPWLEILWLLAQFCEQVCASLRVWRWILVMVDWFLWTTANNPHKFGHYKVMDSPVHMMFIDVSKSVRTCAYKSDTTLFAKEEFFLNLFSCIYLWGRVSADTNFVSLRRRTSGLFVMLTTWLSYFQKICHLWSWCCSKECDDFLKTAMKCVQNFHVYVTLSCSTNALYVTWLMDDSQLHIRQTIVDTELSIFDRELTRFDAIRHSRREDDDATDFFESVVGPNPHIE